jgi:uncharacterized Zn-binding protein involved in type VI secretion
MSHAKRLWPIGVFAFVAPAMAAAAPAARAGDTTSHGGVVVTGSANVFIGGRPAARAGNFATCPLVTNNVPHVGGPIVTGAATVLINGAPAARAGDTVAETGAISTIVTGAPTVQIGTSSLR